MKKIIDYIPKKKQEAIKDAYHDEDGYWITLKDGWKVKDYFAEHVIHEDTLTEIRSVVKNITRE